MLRVLSLLTGLAAAVVLVLSPPALARGHHRVRPCAAGLVALTFDDGPSSSVTPHLVHILRKAKVPATFFMVGTRVRSAPSAARLVARSGFRIGNHTWDHKELTLLSDAGVRQELSSTAHALHAAHVHPTHLMRPPYGALNDRVRGVLRSMHLSPILWTIDTRDWAGGTGPQIAARALGALRRHGDNVILQHDGVANSPNSVSGVPQIIRGARARGFCFARVGRDGRPVVPRPHLGVRITAGAEHAGAVPRAVTVHLRLARPTSHKVSVRVTTRDLTATAGVDYVAVNRRVRFPVGTTRRTVRIRVLGDQMSEPVEELQVRMRRPRGLIVRRGTYVATIAGDVSVPPTTSIVPVSSASLRALLARS